MGKSKNFFKIKHPAHQGDGLGWVKKEKYKCFLISIHPSNEGKPSPPGFVRGRGRVRSYRRRVRTSRAVLFQFIIPSKCERGWGHARGLILLLLRGKICAASNFSSCFLFQPISPSDSCVDREHARRNIGI